MQYRTAGILKSRNNILIFAANTAMSNDNWVETEREYEFDPQGNRIPKKVKLVQAHFKPARKEMFDFYLRLIGSVSILVPLLLLYFQRSNEIHKENRLEMTKLYTDLAKDFPVWHNAWQDDSINLQLQIAAIYDKYIPRINVYGDDALAQKFDELHQMAYVVNYAELYQQQLSEIVLEAENFYDSIGADARPFMFENERFKKDSGILFKPLHELFDLDNKLQESSALMRLFAEDSASWQSYHLPLPGFFNLTDSIENTLGGLTTVPVAARSYYNSDLVKTGTAALAIPEFSDDYKDKIVELHNAIAEMETGIFSTYTDNIKLFQKDMLNYIK